MGQTDGLFFLTYSLAIASPDRRIAKSYMLEIAPREKNYDFKIEDEEVILLKGIDLIYLL